VYGDRRQVLSFKVLGGMNDKPMIFVKYKDQEKKLCVKEVSSMVLSKMYNIVVIIVPVYFNDSQRKATTDIDYIINLNVVRIINEPVVATIVYGLNEINDCIGKQNIFLHFGGGTFDVSLLTIENKVFRVKSTMGNTHLGGEDIDNVMVNYVVE